MFFWLARLVQSIHSFIGLIVTLSPSFYSSPLPPFFFFILIYWSYLPKKWGKSEHRSLAPE